MPNSRPPSLFRRLLPWVLAIPLAAWMGLAIGLRLPGPRLLSTSLGLLIPLACCLMLLRWPGWKGAAGFSLGFLLVLAGFLSLRPSNDRDWMPDVAKVPWGTLEGSRLTLHNVRNCSYRSETNYEARFEDRIYDLDRLRGIDLFLVSWGPRHIAHTMLSFDFGDGEHLAFSIETRKERTESYSALKGFFREYELCIVAGDERDLVGLRTHVRKESVRLYRLNTPPPVAKGVLRDYVARINGLASHPEWYNALTDNCTTAMIGPLHRRSNRLPWSWKLIASGHLDELLYEQGLVDRTEPFEVMWKHALLNERAERVDLDGYFCRRIREAVPGS